MRAKIWKGCFLLTIGICLYFSRESAVAHAEGFPIVGALHAGGKPEALAVDQSTHKLYIAYEGPGSVVCFEPVSGRVCWRANLGDGITDLVVDSGGQRVFATYNLYRSNKSYLSILNSASGQEMGKYETGRAGENSVAIDHKRAIVIVGSVETGMMYLFRFAPEWQNMAKASTIERVKIGTHPSALAINSKLGRFYVADRQENVLRVLDEETMREMSTIAIGAVPLPPIRVDEQSGRLYLLCSTSQELEVIDGIHNSIVQRVEVGPYPEGLAVRTATGRIYVADEGENEAGRQQSQGKTISVLDGSSYELLGTMNVGTSPDGVEADPGLHRIYVAVEDSNTVVEISDSPDLPLQSGSTLQQRARARTFASWLGQASWITVVIMLLTMVLAALDGRLLRRRELGSPQTQPGFGSSRSDPHSLLR